MISKMLNGRLESVRSKHLQTEENDDNVFTLVVKRTDVKDNDSFGTESALESEEAKEDYTILNAIKKID